jgi:NAD/NADP transhydrogenase alpha subunit
MYAQQAQEVDIIITTALIPGKPAPKLITAEMVQSMKPGSVIVDMAAEQGGNCELTEPGQSVVKHGVTIVGYTDLASRLARQSSTLYGTNLFRLSEELCKTKDGVINVNMEDDAIRGLTVIKNGEITWPAPPLKQAAPPPPKPAVSCGREEGRPRTRQQRTHARQNAGHPVCSGSAVAFWFVGAYAPAAFLGHFTVFVLACFIGNMVVWNVTPALHTPLMSVTNAISSIIAIGALVQIAPPMLGVVSSVDGRPDGLIRGLAFVALVLTAINMFGGFAVTAACWTCSANKPPRRKRNTNMSQSLSNMAYLGAAILFILSLGGACPTLKPHAGATCSACWAWHWPVVATVLGPRVTPDGVGWIVMALVIGGGIGLFAAKVVKMTQMPELVALMHSLVGLAACLVGFASYVDTSVQFSGAEKVIHEVEIYIGILIGAVTFSGSLIAFGKLNGKIGGKPLLLPGRHWLNLAALVIVIVFGRRVHPRAQRGRRHVAAHGDDCHCPAVRRAHGHGHWRG